MRRSEARIKYLGHILRHPDSSESMRMFNPSHSLHTIPSPVRRGAPLAHWPGLAFAEAAHRATVYRNSPSLLGHFAHDFYRHFTTIELKQFSSVMCNTTRFLHPLLLIAENHKQWIRPTPKLK